MEAATTSSRWRTAFFVALGMTILNFMMALLFGWTYGQAVEISLYQVLAIGTYVVAARS